METPFEKRMKFLEDEDSEEHLELQKRLKKTFYCGKMKKNIDCQSLAMTELAVEYLQELVPRELGRIDMFWASSLSRDVTVTPCALMLALIYLKRLKDNNSQYLNQVSSSDLFLISVLVASKYLYDEGESHDVSNIQWACQTKTDIEDINESERMFLSAMDWKIFVKPEEFWSFLQDMEEKVAWKMSMRRNSFTYTDLFVIISSSSTQQVLYDALLELCEMAAVFMTAYIGCVLTLCASNVIPAVIFSHALVPISSTSQPDISAFVHDLPLPARLFRPLHCVPAIKRIPRRSLHHLMNTRLNFNTISSPDIPQVCQPWSLVWNPAVCIQASACVTTCVTIALIEELAVHGYSALLNFNSLMSGFGQSFKVNLFGGRSYDTNSPGMLRGGCSGCGVTYPQNISVSSSSASSNSLVCALSPSGVYGKSVEANVAKRNHENCAERSGHHLYWNAPPFVHHIPTERNHSQSYSSMPPMSRLVQVSG